MIKGYYTTEENGHDSFTFSSLSLISFAILANNAGKKLLTVKAVFEDELKQYDFLPSLFS